MKSPFDGFWWLMFMDIMALIFLVYWWITDGFDPLRDFLLIGIWGVMNIVIFATRWNK